MKNIILIGSILSSASFNFGQTGTPPALGTNPPTTQTTANFAWYRGGNNPTGPAGVNNIFGTRWASDIFIMTNNTNIGKFSNSNGLNGLNGNGDGLRIFNQNSSAAAGLGEIDIFTSGTSNATEIRWGASGNIRGADTRFEMWGNYKGLFFNAAQAGTFKFARSGAVTAFVGTNDFWRIGKQLDAQNFNANRRLEVADNFIQFRLTYAAPNTLGTQYTDFLSNSLGNLQILPLAGKVGINIASNPTEGIDVEGNARIRQLPLLANEAALAVNKVVMVDANGVLKWRDASNFGGIGVASNAAWINSSDEVEWGTNPLMHNTKIPMSTFNVLFNTPALSDNSLTIGGPVNTSGSRLYVDNDNLPMGAIVRSHSPNSSYIPTRIGLAAYAFYGTSLTGTLGYVKNGDQLQGVYGYAINGNNTTIGVRGYATSTNVGSINLGSDFIASGGSVYENDGVRGYADGSVKTNFGGKFKAGGSGTLSIGVYGEATTPVLGGPAYAGYFAGTVITTGGSLWASDSTLKENITPITDLSDSLLMSVQPMSFDYRQNGNAARLNLPDGTRFGILAQQVEPLFPSIVKTATHPAEYDSLGLEIAPSFQYKVVDVSQLVPIMLSDLQKKTSIISNQSSQIGVLTNSVDSMNTVVSDLNDRLTQLENCLSGILPFLCQMNNSAIQPTQEIVQEQLRAAINVNLSDRNSIILNQNVPNPFAESTIITFSIPASVQKAQIHFYDGQGKLINSVDIVERGNGQLNVFANDLSTGVYTYSLVADGQIVSTKRMVKD